MPQSQHTDGEEDPHDISVGVLVWREGNIMTMKNGYSLNVMRSSDKHYFLSIIRKGDKSQNTLLIWSQSMW